jgi:hypothetical protein
VEVRGTAAATASTGKRHCAKKKEIKVPSVELALLLLECTLCLFLELLGVLSKVLLLASQSLFAGLTVLFALSELLFPLLVGL